jgi:predicted Zn-dependent peptidase
VDFFKDHPLGRPIAGRAETVMSFHRKDFVDFFRNRYRPLTVIVSAAGHVSHDELVREMAARLGSNGKGGSEIPAHLEVQTPPAMGKGVFVHRKPLEQVHLCLGMVGTQQSHPQRYAAYVLNTLLGGGMSSRLFQEIREKRGKAYSVYSFAAAYKDVGYFGIYAGTSREWTKEVVELILQELKNLAAGEIKQAEIERTQGQLVGSMILGLESTDSWMSHIARNEIYFGKPITTDEICAGVRSVTRDEVVNLAQALFHSGTLTLSLLGDFKDDFTISSLL